MVLLLLMLSSLFRTNKEKMQIEQKGDKELKNKTMINKNQVQKKQEAKIGEQETTNRVF